ncbi:response regulator [Pseudomonas sp. HMWF006]|uniref:response regulator n=1 Tax=Pseudomonas sp. HMWF006 TaxID=2056843 RepID=UPI000D4ADC93|nr:response regulator [Pseudomonas sp. HMWF006]PTT00187.1 response regulator [Pseudomonas sp. HMWF006]PTT74031.1 response regulator [Pseudomonas sp. HMWF007]PTT91058.1 response regulator [Pseudomonas sp. HMWF005]
MKDLNALISDARILVVEDDAVIREILVDTLSDMGAFVRAVETAQQGLRAIEEEPWTLLLTDIETPGSIDGLELAWFTSEKNFDTAIIVSSGGYKSITAKIPKNAKFLPKPWLQDSLLTAIRSQLEMQQLKKILAIELV